MSWVGHIAFECPNKRVITLAKKLLRKRKRKMKGRSISWRSRKEKKSLQNLMKVKCWSSGVLSMFRGVPRTSKGGIYSTAGAPFKAKFAH